MDVELFLLVGLLLALIGLPSISFLSARSRASLIISLGIILVICSALVFLSEHDQSSLASVALRAIGISLILFVGLRASGRTGGAVSKAFGLFPLVVCPPLFAFIFVSTIPHAQYSNFLLYGVVGTLALFALARGGELLGRHGLLNGPLVAGLSLVLVLSLFTGIFLPEYGIEQGRLRGVLENANLLGFFAFALASLCLLSARRVYCPSVFVLCVVTLLWTASRASTIALILVVLLTFITRLTAKKIFWTTVVATPVALVALMDLSVLSGLGELKVLRSGDSRASSIETATYDWGSSFWFGVGYNNESAIIASSAFRALSNGGLLGVSAVAVLCLSLLILSLLRSPQVFIFTVSAVFHSFFEGWLLSPFGPMILIFTLVWLSLSGSAERNLDPPLYSEFAVEPGLKHGV